MSQYLCLFSLILQGLHKEGECRQVGFWPGKGANIRDLFCTAPKVLILHGSFFSEYIKNTERKKFTRGPHPAHEGGGAPLPRGPPSGPPVAIFCYMKSFDEKKIRSLLLGQNSAATRRNLGGTNLGLWQSYSAGETSLQEGKSSPTILSSGGGQSPSTSSSTPSPLKTLVHLLYPILYQNYKLVLVGC